MSPFVYFPENEQPNRFHLWMELSVSLGLFARGANEGFYKGSTDSSKGSNESTLVEVQILKV